MQIWLGLSSTNQETKNYLLSRDRNERDGKAEARDGWRDKADRRKIKGEKPSARAAKSYLLSESCEQISAVITNKFSTRNEVRKRERVNPKVRPKGVRSYFWYLADGKPGEANKDQRRERGRKREERMLRGSNEERTRGWLREREKSPPFPSWSRLAESS